MNDTLERWPRSLFVPIPLRSFYFFVSYGTLDETYPPIPHDRYRSRGLAEGLELSFFSLEDRPELKSDFQRGAGWEEFLASSAQTVESIQHASACLVLRGELPDADHLDSLRDSIGLIMFLLDHGGTAVCDVLTGSWYSSLDWRLRIFDEGAEASKALVALHSIEQPNGRLHLYTRGLRRFARPDLSMEDVRLDEEASRLKIIDHLVDGLIAGGSIPDGQRLHFPEFDTSVVCRWQGSLDDPQFFNFQVDLRN